MKLTIQTLIDGNWQDAANLSIEDPALGRTGRITLDYPSQDYVIAHLNDDCLAAVSAVMPVDLFTIYRSDNWFAFIDDLMPSGASRRYWVAKLGLGHATPAQQDTELLRVGTIAPVGNLRIKESLELLETPADDFDPAKIRFPMSDLVERDAAFLDYAQALGAASGGATGAGGEAPKLLVRLSDDDQVWIDTFQDQPENLDGHYLVKFPRGNKTDIDCDILRAECVFYRLLQDMGMDTVDKAGLRLVEGERYPTLWIPRFDVSVMNGKQLRQGMESVYSLLGKFPGAALNHFDCIERLSNLLRQQNASSKGFSFDQQAFVIEWVKRDFLNVCFGNSDNHGGNTAFLKSAQGIRLSPIFDFAPMRADPEGVTRTTSWGANFDFAGNYNWIAIAKALANYVDPEQLISELRALAAKLYGLRDQLQTLGVSERLLNMPAVGLIYLDNNLKKWELL